MIHDHDRSIWIGASDTSMVMGNWKTATFSKWWLQKLGINKDRFESKAMKVGNAFEHKILDAIPQVCEKDAQIRIPELGLRVNYDGLGADCHIYEVKTSGREFKLSKAYWQQAQVEMFAMLWATGDVPDMDVVAYEVGEQEYANYFTPIDKARLKFIPVEYDPSFIEEYKEKLEILHECILRGAKP